MRFVRTLTGMLLLTIALPVLLAGVALAIAGGRRDPGGAYRLTIEMAGAPGWLAPLGWGLLGLGAGLTLLAIGLALRPARRTVPPREVVFVVEPTQVPVLAGRLGVTSLDDLGGPTGDRTADTPQAGPTTVDPDLPTLGGSEPDTLSAEPEPAPVALRLAWPAARPHQEGRPLSHPPVSTPPAGPEREPGRRRPGPRTTGKHLRDRP